jgi:hypothetical protein
MGTMNEDCELVMKCTLIHSWYVHIVTWWLEVRIVEQDGTATRQQYDKHISVAANKHETIEELLEAVFCI